MIDRFSWNPNWLGIVSSGKIERETDTRGVHECPASFHAVPCGAVARNLLSLDLTETAITALKDQSRTHHIYAVTSGLLGGIIRACTPPDSLTQALRVRGNRQRRTGLDHQWILLVLRRGSCHPLPVNGVKEAVELFARHIATAAISDLVQCSSFLSQVQRVFVAHMAVANTGSPKLGCMVELVSLRKTNEVAREVTVIPEGKRAERVRQPLQLDYWSAITV